MDGENREGAAAAAVDTCRTSSDDTSSVTSSSRKLHDDVTLEEKRHGDKCNMILFVLRGSRQAKLLILAALLAGGASEFLAPSLRKPCDLASAAVHSRQLLARKTHKDAF